MRLKFFLFIVLLSSSISCGKIDHNISGDADVNLKFNLKEIEDYYIVWCRNQRVTDVVDCAKNKVAEFLETLNRISR